MTLREPVELVAPDRLGALHLIALGATGMSGIALGYHAVGIPVSGCDRTDSPALRHLAELGIETHVGHDPAQLEGVSTVVVSSAIPPDNVELVAARRAGLRVWHRSTELAALMLGAASALMGAMTHYASGPAALIFGAGYLTTPEYFRIGAVCGVVMLATWLTVGLGWWLIIGIW